MAPSADKKKSKQIPKPPVPCEVFFACTLCANRCRSVPQLYTHYRNLHKDLINGKDSPKSRKKAKSENDSTKECDAASSDKTEEGKVKMVKRKHDDGEKGDTTVSGCDNSSDAAENRDKKLKTGDGEGKSRSETSQGGASDKSDGAMLQSSEKDCTVTRKRNIPLGMLEGKRNSLMVIFQHADETKPLPEGSSFKLRNGGGEQTYVVVANVDVDIIEHGKPSKKSKKV